MRTAVLIAAMVLVSASAQAGQFRNLSVAGTDSRPISAPLPPAKNVIAEVPPPAAVAAPETGAPPVATAPIPPPLPAVTAAPPAAEAPKYVERPTVSPATTDTKADDAKPSRRAERRHRGGYWTAGRIMGELQRYGVYW